MTEPSVPPVRTIDTVEEANNGVASPDAELEQDSGSPQNDPKGFSREFLLAFSTIFLAELGDKTQLSTLLMTAESKSPWVVFTGAAAALITTSLLGVVIGRWLARYLSPDALKTATGASLLFIAVLLIWDTVHI